MATEGEAVRAVAWYRDRKWWAAGRWPSGEYGDPVELRCSQGTGAQATAEAAERFGVPLGAVVLVAASYAPDLGARAAEVDTAGAYGLRSEATAGEELDRVAVLVEVFQQWDDGGPMQYTLDAVEALLPQLGAPALTGAERDALVAGLAGETLRGLRAAEPASALAAVLPESGPIPCPYDGCEGEIVEVDHGLAWRPMWVEGEHLNVSDDSEPSWEGDGWQCQRCLRPVEMPDEYHERVNYV